METVKDACKLLSKNLIWWQIEPDTTQIDKDLDEFNEMTDRFYEIAKKNFFKVEQLANGEVLALAINYIDRAISLPPLRGHYSWFDNTLSVLLEMCNPNSLLTKKEIKFIECLEAV